MRRAVILLFASSLILALGLLLAYESAIASWYRGESTFLTALFKPGPSLARTTTGADTLFRSFNRLYNAGLGQAMDKGKLAALAQDASPLVVTLRSGQDILYSSRPLGPEAAEALPAYGSLSQRHDPVEEDGEFYYAIRQFDFRGPGGEEASFFVLRPPDSRVQGRLPYTRQLALVVALLLLAADGAVGVWFTIRIAASLGRLEISAGRIGSGDLETPVDSTEPFVELSSVFVVLESMREKIGVLLKEERLREQERRELIANLSHDLRTPLSALRGYVDGLREGIANTPEKSDRYLAVIAEKTALLERMTGELLLLSTLDEDAAPPQALPLDLGAFLQGGVEELVLSRSGAGISFEFDLPPGPPILVLADPGQLRRVVENLTDNALRHGGRKSIRLRFSLAREGGRALARIEDDGRGIPEAELERIFERFRRLDPERSGGGSGLGLAIARKLVEANGGSIRAYPSPLGGLGLVIDLPLAGGNAAQGGEA